MAIINLIVHIYIVEFTHYFHNNVYTIFYMYMYIGNQLNPESLFQKDLDIDPFVASTPEQIQEDYDAMQVSSV